MTCLMSLIFFSHLSRKELINFLSIHNRGSIDVEFGE